MTGFNLQRDWDARFRAFAARKEREARDARLSPFTTEIDASRTGLTGLLSIGDSWSRRLWNGPFQLSPAPSVDLPAVSLVFVQSLDGNTGAADPATLGGGATDTHLIYEGLSRVAADAVLAGAATIRGADAVFSVWREELVALRASLGKPRHPVQIVATLAGLALDGQLLFNIPDLPVVLLTVDAGLDAMREALRSRPWITAITMPHKTGLVPAFREMRRMGIEQVSAVGGPTIATSLIDSGLVQDVFVTTSPRPGGDPHTPMYPRPLDARLVTRKHGTGDASGVVFDYLTLISNSLGQSLPVTNSRS